LTIMQIRQIPCNSYLIYDGQVLILSLIYEDFSKLYVKLNERYGSCYGLIVYLTGRHTI
jgi:hypothetical protein